MCVCVYLYISTCTYVNKYVCICTSSHYRPGARSVVLAAACFFCCCFDGSNYLFLFCLYCRNTVTLNEPWRGKLHVQPLASWTDTELLPHEKL